VFLGSIRTETGGEKQNTDEESLLPTHAAYIAGLIDGEGTITLTRKHQNENRQLAITISNTDRALLDFVLSTAPRRSRYSSPHRWQRHHHPNPQTSRTPATCLWSRLPYVYIKRM
jgi:hypothetical protein